MACAADLATQRSLRSPCRRRPLPFPRQPAAEGDGCADPCHALPLARVRRCRVASGSHACASVTSSVGVRLPAIAADSPHHRRTMGFERAAGSGQTDTALAGLTSVRPCNVYIPTLTFGRVPDTHCRCSHPKPGSPATGCGSLSSGIPMPARTIQGREAPPLAGGESPGPGGPGPGVGPGPGKPGSPPWHAFRASGSRRSRPTRTGPAHGSSCCFLLRLRYLLHSPPAPRPPRRRPSSES